jgi:hypothetical protein
MLNPNANPRVVGRAPLHTFARLSLEQKAEFYRDISFWLTGSDETPFIFVEAADAEEVQATEPIWRPRPDWGTSPSSFFL